MLIWRQSGATLRDIISTTSILLRLSFPVRMWDGASGCGRLEGRSVSPLTRRRFLGGAAAAGGATALGLLPTSVQRALAAAPSRTPQLRDIEHVVLLMQENRSFDHYFGTLSGVAGFDDPNIAHLPNGDSLLYQPDPRNPDGYVLPFHLDTKTTNAQSIPSTDHSWGTQHAAWNNGRSDNWMPAHRATDGGYADYIMGYYSRGDIPFHFALADAFTICDQYHCSVFGPTWPNRLHWFTGTIDADGRYGGPTTSNWVPASGLRWTTYAERLERAGISWKVYQQNDSYNTNLNMLVKFASFRNASTHSNLYKKGLAISSSGQFEYDAEHDRLPAVSWLIPTTVECEHPAVLPAAGAQYIASKISAIAANPDVWVKTAFIINYDENDGLFDHVIPPTPPQGTAHEFVGGMPIGGGFRVPCLVISPWTAGGYVASEKFDHTSVLRFLERFTGVREPNISAWRRASFGDLTSVFRFGQPRRTLAPLPATGPLLVQAEAAVAHLPPPDVSHSSQSVPHQETGGRPHI